MASTVPIKSQSLHNFTLPHHLKWNKDGHSGGHHQRRRSIKSPSRRPNTASPSPLHHSPLRDSILAPPPRHRFSLRDSTAPPSPARRDYYLDKQPSAHGDASAPFLVHKWGRCLSIGCDPPSRHLHRHDSSSRKGHGLEQAFSLKNGCLM